MDKITVTSVTCSSARQLCASQQANVQQLLKYLTKVLDKHPHFQSCTGCISKNMTKQGRDFLSILGKTRQVKRGELQVIGSYVRCVTTFLAWQRSMRILQAPGDTGIINRNTGTTPIKTTVHTRNNRKFRDRFNKYSILRLFFYCTAEMFLCF